MEVERSTLLRAVQRAFSEIAPGNSAQVSLQARFVEDLGLDSLARMELLQRVEQQLGVCWPDEVLSRANTASDLLGQAPADASERGAVSAERIASAHCDPPHHAATFVDVLEWHARRAPQAVHATLLTGAQGGEARAYSFRTLLDDARTFASFLLEQQLPPSGRVVLMQPTGYEFLRSFLGVLLAGGVPVPIYPPSSIKRLADHVQRHERILANVRPSIVYTFDEARAVAHVIRRSAPRAQLVSNDEVRVRQQRRAFPAVGAQSLALIQYTSGSTGAPKGVMLTHANLLHNIRALGEALSVRSGDVVVSWLPLYHDMGLIGAWLGALYFGLPLVLMSPMQFLARPVRWLEAITQYQGTISAAPNFAFERCARGITDRELAGLDLRSWRVALNGAEPVRAQSIRLFQERFAPVGFQAEAMMPVYGLAENTLGVSVPKLGRAPRIERLSRSALEQRGKVKLTKRAEGATELVSCGVALPGVSLRIVSSKGTVLGERAIGELQFRSPSATPGYYENPDASAALLDGQWRRTGDLAFLLNEELFICGRTKDVIIRGGRNIYPQEIEEIASSVTAVRAGGSAAFSVPSDEGVQVVVVVESTAPNARHAEIAAQVREKVAQRLSLSIDRVLIVPRGTVPKTSSGKVRRAECRELFMSGTLLEGGTSRAIRLRLFLLRLAFRIARIPRVLRGVWAWVVFLCGALIALLGCIVLRHPAARRRFLRPVVRAALAVAGCPLRVRGKTADLDDPRVAVLVSNHASYLDAIVLSAVLPERFVFVAKEELAKSPVLCGLLRLLGVQYIARGDTRRAHRQLEQVEQLLAAGGGAVFFPEGGFTRSPGVRPFRLGAFLLAARAGKGVLPLALRGTRNVLPDGSWNPTPQALELRIAGALFPDSEDAHAAAYHLAQQAREIVAREVGE